MKSLLLFFAGEIIGILFILFFVFGFTILVVGLTFYIRYLVVNKNRVAWGRIAQNLNFTMPNPKNPEMFGKINGCEVKAAIGVRYRNTGEHSRAENYTYCVSEFPHSLRFLLDIKTPKGMLSGVLGANDISTGQEGFDRTFNVECYDENVVRNLLLSNFPSDKTQNLMGDLMLARQVVGIINVTDKKVYIEKPGRVDDENGLRNMIEITAYLAKRFQTAREKFPFAEWEKQMFANWKNIARENNFQFDKQNVQMQGVYKNFPVLIALNTEKGKWETQLKLRFPKSLMVGLKLMPENSLHKALSWFGMQDIKVGIKEFDDAFIVKGKNVQMAKHKLQPEVCRNLVALSRKSSSYLITDEEFSVTFETVLGDDKMLKSYLEAIVATSKMLLR